MAEQQPTPVEEKVESEPAPTLPDYVLSPNAVFNDEDAHWRYGRAPDYSKTRKVWEEGRKMNHAAGSLPQLVENLVKNWEVEASFKPRLDDWRTIDREKYAFAMSGGPGQSGEHMLKVGTYNAIIAPNEYYDPSNSDFASSHKTFKRMMPTFAWEVIEVFSGPPKVVFKWRHWGEMKNDYVGFNNKGQKVTAKAHGGPIEIFGTTIAVVNDKLQVESLDTYMDSLDMFRQIAPHGVVNAEPMNHKVSLSDALEVDVPNNDGMKIAQAHEQSGTPVNADGKHISNSTGQAADAFVPYRGACPFMGSSGMNGAQAPHPLPLPPQEEGAMSVDPSSASADTEFSDSVLVGRETLVPQSLPSLTIEAQTKSADAQEPAAQQGASMDPDDQTTTSSLQPTASHNTTTGAPNTTIESSKRPAPSSIGGEDEHLPGSIYSSAVTGDIEPVKAARRRSFIDESTATQTRDAVDTFLDQPATEVHPHAKDVEAAVQPVAGEAVIASADAAETKEAKREMSEVKPGGEEEGMIMNRE